MACAPDRAVQFVPAPPGLRVVSAGVSGSRDQKGLPAPPSRILAACAGGCFVFWRRCPAPHPASLLPSFHEKHSIRCARRADVSAIPLRLRQCHDFGHGRLPRVVRRSGARLRRLLGQPRARPAALEQAVHQGARRKQCPVLQVVRGRRAQRLLQLPGPQPAEWQRRKDGDRVRGRRRHRDARVLPGPARAGLPLCQWPEKARHQEGRPRGDLHADVGRRRGGDAGLRASRCHAFGRVRRLLGQVAAGAAGRRRRRGADHRRRADARRQGAAAQGHSR